MDRQVKEMLFGPGPWIEEPDRVVWEAHGLPCLIRRHKDLGFLCGYVAVPPEHPLHGVQYGEACRLVDLPAHGEVSYSKPCEDDVCHEPAPGQPADVWWFGFHCGCGWDWVPHYGPWLGREPEPENYRDLNYVHAVCEQLAAALAAVA